MAGILLIPHKIQNNQQPTLNFHFAFALYIVFFPPFSIHRTYFGVIHTLETISQSHLVWTVAVSIAFAFLLALFPHIAKVTGTSVWSCTSSIHALIMTVWFTFSTEKKRNTIQLGTSSWVYLQQSKLI